MPEAHFNLRVLNTRVALKLLHIPLLPDQVARVKGISVTHTGTARSLVFFSHNRIHLDMDPADAPANDSEINESGGGPDIWAVAQVGNTGTLPSESSQRLDKLIAGSQVVVVISENSAESVVHGRVVYDIERVGGIDAAVVRFSTQYSERYAGKPDLQAFPWSGSGF